MINIEHFIFNELEVNSFVLSDDSGSCIIIDPGCKIPVQQQKLKDYINSRRLQPTAIVLTHGHFDHVAGTGWAKHEFGCPLVMHRDDLFLVKGAVQHASLFGIRLEEPPAPDRFIEEGETVTFGEAAVSVLHVPGHSPGSICLYSEKDNLLVCGDVLFNGSIGRTDLFGGNHEQLIRGIREKLLVLPPETVVWPGHGPSTTIGSESVTNPFLI
jgi:hydroxyacylglutathione hydrolase